MEYKTKLRSQKVIHKWLRNTLKCSTFLVIKETQIKTTLTFYLITVIMANINKTNDSTCWRGCMKGGNLFIAGESENWHSHYGNQCGCS